MSKCARFERKASPTAREITPLNPLTDVVLLPCAARFACCKPLPLTDLPYTLLSRLVSAIKAWRTANRGCALSDVGRFHHTLRPGQSGGVLLFSSVLWVRIEEVALRPRGTTGCSSHRRIYRDATSWSFFLFLPFSKYIFMHRSKCFL